MMNQMNVVLESIITSGNAVMNNKIGHAPIFKDKEHLYQIMNNLFMVWDDKKRDKWLRKVMSLWSQIEEQLASKSLFVNHPNLADTIAKQCQCAARLIIKNHVPYLVIGVEKRNDNTVFIDCVNIPILNSQEGRIDFNKLLKEPRKHKYPLPNQFSTFFAGSPLLNTLFNPIYKTKSTVKQDPNCLSDLRDALLIYQQNHNDTELLKLLVMCQGHCYRNYTNGHLVGVVFNKNTFKKCMDSYTEDSNLDKLFKHAQISNFVIGELQTNANDEIISLPISFQIHISNNWMIDNLFPNNLADAWKQTQQEAGHKMFEVNQNVQVNITPAIKQRAFWIDGLSFFTNDNNVYYIQISQELSLFGGNYFSNQWKADTMNCLITWLSNPTYHDDLVLKKMLEMFVDKIPSKYGELGKCEETFENFRQSLYLGLEDSTQIMMLYSVFDFYPIDLQLQHVNLKFEDNRLICTLKNVELRDDPKMKTMTTFIKTLFELMPTT